MLKQIVHTILFIFIIVGSLAVINEISLSSPELQKDSLVTLLNDIFHTITKYAVYLLPLGIVITGVAFVFSFGSGRNIYTTVKDEEKTSAIVKREGLENDQLSDITKLVNSNMNAQVSTVIHKCRQVHNGYHNYPNFNYERSAFYNSDLPTIHEFMTVYSKTTELKKSDMDHMVNSMAKFENHLDDILNMQQESLLNKFRVALDVLKARK